MRSRSFVSNISLFLTSTPIPFGSIVFIQKSFDELFDLGRLVSMCKILCVCHKFLLDSKVRETVNQNMVEPTPDTFDKTQLQIYTFPSCFNCIHKMLFCCYRPSLDEVAEWGRSFDKLMKSEGKQVF